MTTTSTILSPRCALLVDSSVVDRVALQNLFDRYFPDYSLIQTGSAAEAQVLLQGSRFGLYIVESILSDSNGIDLIADIKTVQPDAKVIVCTSASEGEWTFAAIAMGVDAHHRKPANDNELRTSIRTLLNTPNDGTSFSTRIRSVSLLDVIQLKCLNRLKSELQVTSSLGSGTIYIANGEIVHCATENEEGAAAFYTILSWKDGHADDRELTEIPKRTINTRWEHLCMEAAQAADEGHTH